MKPYYEENGITIYHAAKRMRHAIITIWDNGKVISKLLNILLIVGALGQRIIIGKAIMFQCAEAVLGLYADTLTLGLAYFVEIRKQNGTI